MRLASGLIVAQGGAVKSTAREIIEHFEAGRIAEGEALARLETLTGRAVEAGWLREYWRSESIDDFVDRLCAEPIANWQTLTEDEVEALIAEFIAGASPGRRDQIEDAIEKRFRKSPGVLIDLVDQKQPSDPKEILRELKKDTVIYL
jgi:hypothetical protein